VINCKIAAFIRKWQFFASKIGNLFADFFTNYESETKQIITARRSP